MYYWPPPPWVLQWFNPWYQLPDPVYLTTLMTQYIVYPYYYALTLKIYEAMIDTWRKTMENMIKQLSSENIIHTSNQ